MILKFKKTNLIQLVLVFIWLFLTLLYIKNEEFGLLSLDDRRSISDLKFSQVYEMLKGDYVYGEFYSQYPNLGTVRVRFNTFGRINDDELIFRIKEKGSPSWYYENKYKTDQFQSGKLFPFGFPLIKASQGKTYVFEIESLKGVKGNAVVLNGSFPPLSIKHVYTKLELKNSLFTSIYFIKEKILNLISDKGIISNTLIFGFPLLYFSLLTTFGYNLIMSTSIIAFSTIIYIIIGSNSYPLLSISILFAWAIVVYYHKIHSLVSSYIGLVFMTILPIFVIFKLNSIAENIAVISFLFLFFSALQRVYVLNSNWERQVSPNHFKHFFVSEWKKTTNLIYLIATGVVTIALETLKNDTVIEEKLKTDQVEIKFENNKRSISAIMVILVLFLGKLVFFPSGKSILNLVFLSTLLETWGGALMFFATLLIILLIFFILKRNLISVFAHNSSTIAIVAYKQGRLFSRSYLVTTWLVALIVIAIVRLLRLSYKFGPYVLSVWLVIANFTAVKNFVNFYLDFFYSNQLTIFWNQLGKFLLGMYTISLIIFLLVQKGKVLRIKTYIFVLVFSLTLFISDYSFKLQTKFRYDPVIWTVNPNGSSEPWLDVTIVGRNFRDLPFQGKIKIDGLDQRVIYWSDRKVTFRTDPYTTKSGTLIVYPINLLESDAKEFIYYGNNK